MFLFFFFSLVAVEYASKYGRKTLTLLGTYGIAVSLYFISVGYFIADKYETLSQIGVFVCLIFFLFMYGMTYGPLMWMWVAEACQPSQVGKAVMANWVGAALVMILFPIVK